MADIVWEDPAPQERRFNYDHGQIAEQLRARKGVWGRIGQYKTRQSARQCAHYINNGRMLKYAPAGDFEGAWREIEGRFYVFARYLGDGPDE